MLDIDHTPEHWLHPDHAGFYTPGGLAAITRHLVPDGLFGMWADGRPDPAFVDRLGGIFAHARAETITFPNPITGGESPGTVYIAETGSPG